MSKTRIFALSVVVLMLICILTNPSKEQIENTVSNKATSIIKKQLGYQDQGALDLAMGLFGNKIVNEFVGNNIIVNNYYLFSLVKIKWQGEETTIGVGGLKKVWLSSKIDEKTDEIIHILKSL